jgi:hypothetical protein
MKRMLRATLVATIAAMPLTAGTAQAQQDTWAYDETNRIVNAGNTSEAYEANVKVSTTRNLLDRQQVAIQLNDFKLTHNANNTKNNGTYHEYPVIVMQCRGADPTPETCANERRSVYFPGYDAGASQDWRERARKIRSPGSYDGFPGTGDTQKRNALVTEQVPFVAADGTSYLWDDSAKNVNGDPLVNDPTLKSFAPPDTADAGVSLLNTRTIPIKKEAGSDKGVSGEFLFEVRERVSQASLGCSNTVACSIVVVPIMDMVCATDIPVGTLAADCGAPARGEPPGSPTSGPDTINLYKSQRTWLADSNWRNRFVVPISFTPDPATCGINDSRPVISIYGSELADVAQQRWGGAYCAGGREADYLPMYTQGSEYDARRQFTTQLGDGYLQDAVLTTQPVLDSPRPVVHAPSALTGFAVAFTIDDAFGQQVQQMTLSPRLLAKLLTQSYTPSKVSDAIRNSRTRYTGSAEQVAAVTTAGNGNSYYWEHPEVFKNPRNLFQDKEFVALNPELKLRDADDDLAAQFNTYLSPVIFQVQSDIIMDLTRYIVADPTARAWLDGKADEQGMVVNPVWKGMQEFELYGLLDAEVRPARPRNMTTWSETNQTLYNIPGAGDQCDDLMRTPFLTRYANVANSAEKAATALLDRRGSATPLCTFTDVPVPPEEQPNPVPPGDNPAINRVYSEAKVDPAEFGKRAMISVTTVAHTKLYELPAAKLVNAGGHAVAPSPGTMVSALTAAVQNETTGTIELNYSQVTGANAYPGTMVAVTAAPTSGLAADVADNYADFIEFMATDGQIPGDAVTDLAPGYDPLTPNLREQALDAAQAVREQKGEVPPIPPGGPLGGEFASNTVPTDGSAFPNNGTPGAGVSPAGASDDKVDKSDPRNVAQTKGSGSWLSRWALPLLLGFGAVAALAAFVVGAVSQPDHPARRLLRTVLRR